MMHHLTALNRKDHPVEDMQDDFNKYGGESFSFIPLFETSKNLVDCEHFIMAVLRTQNREYGYNYKDKAGTRKDITRDTSRNISTARTIALMESKSFESYFAKVEKLKCINTDNLNDFQKEFIEACIESNSVKSVSEKLNIERWRVRYEISKLLKKYRCE